MTTITKHRIWANAAIVELTRALPNMPHSETIETLAAAYHAELNESKMHEDTATEYRMRNTELREERNRLNTRIYELDEELGRKAPVKVIDGDDGSERDEPDLAQFPKINAIATRIWSTQPERMAQRVADRVGTATAEGDHSETECTADSTIPCECPCGECTEPTSNRPPICRQCDIDCVCGGLFPGRDAETVAAEDLTQAHLDESDGVLHADGSWTPILDILDDPRMAGDVWMDVCDVTPAMLSAWPVWEYTTHRELRPRTLRFMPGANPTDSDDLYRPFRTPGMGVDGIVGGDSMTPAHFDRCAWQWREPAWFDEWRIDDIDKRRVRETVGGDFSREQWRPAAWPGSDREQNEPPDICPTCNASVTVLQDHLLKASTLIAQMQAKNARKDHELFVDYPDLLVRVAELERDHVTMAGEVWERVKWLERRASGCESEDAEECNCPQATAFQRELAAKTQECARLHARIAELTSGEDDADFQGISHRLRIQVAAASNLKGLARALCNAIVAYPEPDTKRLAEWAALSREILKRWDA